MIEAIIPRLRTRYAAIRWSPRTLNGPDFVVRLVRNGASAERGQLSVGGRLIEHTVTMNRLLKACASASFTTSKESKPARSRNRN